MSGFHTSRGNRVVLVTLLDAGPSRRLHLCNVIRPLDGIVLVSVLARISPLAALVTVSLRSRVGTLGGRELLREGRGELNRECYESLLETMLVGG